MSSSRKIRLFSDVGAKMSMFNKRAKEHRDSQMINPFSEWGGPGTRRKLSREDPDYGRPVEGSKTAERGRLAQMQMIGDMVELCDMIYDCGIRSPDGRAAISFGDAFRLYSSINDKVVGLLMRGRKHKILDFEGEMLFQGRDDRKMIELLLPLNTIRHKYGMPERAGCGEVDHELLQMLAEQDRKQKQQRKQQRTRSVGVPPLPPLAPPPVRHQKSRSVDNTWPTAEEARAMLGAVGPEKVAEARMKSGKSAESAEGAENGEGGGIEAAGREQDSAAGEVVRPEDEGAAAAGAGWQGGGGEGRVEQQRESSYTADVSQERHDAMFGAGDAEGEQGMMSIISELMRGQETTFCANASGGHEIASNTEDNSEKQFLPSGADEVDRPPESCLPEIRIGEGHESCAAPTSAKSETPETTQTESVSPVKHGEGQGRMSRPDASDLHGSPGVTAVDNASASDRGLTPEEATNPTPTEPKAALESELEPEPEQELKPEPKPLSEQELETEGEAKSESTSQQEQTLEPEETQEPRAKSEPDTEHETEKEPERKPMPVSDLASPEFGGANLQEGQCGPEEVAAR